MYFHPFMDGQYLSDLLFMVPLDGRFARGPPPMMVVIYGRLSLLVSLLLPLVPTLAVLYGDLPLGDSSLSLFPPFM